MPAKDDDILDLDYSGPGTGVIPLGNGDQAEVLRIKSGASVEMSAAKWEKAKALPHVQRMIAAKELRASRRA
jgi:hypothetical protein